MKESELIDVKEFLDEKHFYYERPEFIENDPISLPHLFSKKQDIEIAGLFAAVFAWGQRKTIISKSKEILGYMDFAPYDFILNHKENDLKKMLDFKHRTFNSTDLLYFIHFLKKHYSGFSSLENAFFPLKNSFKHPLNIERGLIHFHDYFFDSEDAPMRTKKHVSTPVRGSACKRLNMFLRWMVRKDQRKVDFGLWEKIRPDMLICPLDVHVYRVAHKLKLLHRKQADWKAALSLTENLKKLDPEDPVKYDFALFGLGVIEKF